jgi:hypothetical protein
LSLLLPAWSSQVKSLIINNSFFHFFAKGNSEVNNGIFRGYGVAEAPPGFHGQYVFFSLFLEVSIKLAWLALQNTSKP